MRKNTRGAEIVYLGHNEVYHAGRRDISVGEDDEQPLAAQPLVVLLYEVRDVSAARVARRVAFNLYDFYYSFACRKTNIIKRGISTSKCSRWYL